MLLPFLELFSLLQSFFFFKLELPNINNPRTAADTNKARHFIFMICLLDNILCSCVPLNRVDYNSTMLSWGDVCLCISH